MATRTTTTSRIRTVSCSSADRTAGRHDGYSFEKLVVAYEDCRRTKRRKPSALAFEAEQEALLYELHEDLAGGRWAPGVSSCFVITRPKDREVWAAPFRDRIVHHLVYNEVHAAIERTFIADSCACIPGRGTLYGALRLEAKVRSLTQNWQRPAWALKLDLANFFVSIPKPTLQAELERRIRTPWALELALQILWNDPRQGAVYKSPRWLRERVPLHKRLGEADADRGLPIGNLSSQFYANVLLDVLDQHIKHRLHVRHYTRYVDDMVLLASNPQDANRWGGQIAAFLPARLGLELNPAKTVLQRVDNGVDFVGQVLKPWRRHTRRRTIRAALQRIAEAGADDLLSTANSYFGLAGQASASHRDRARIAKAVMARGHSVNRGLTQTFRRNAT